MILESFLTNRSQFVKVGTECSGTRILTYGIGQGTILGPLIFNIFINDLMSIELRSKSQFFSDDGALIFSAPTYPILRNLMQQDIIEVQNWLIKNKLSLNVVKTKFMLFYRSVLKEYLPFNDINFSAGIITRVETFDYLGLTLDSELSFKDHVRKVIMNIKPYVAILHRLKFYLKTKDLKLIYYTFIHSI